MPVTSSSIEVCPPNPEHRRIILNLGVYGHKMFVGLCLLTAVCMAVGIRWGWRAEPQSDSPIGSRWHFSVRWA
jgi:hypothetical protein